MRFPLLFSLFTAGVAGYTAAQTPMFPQIQAPVFQDGRTLLNPFAGGLNAAQVSAADLNNDGVQDLVVFDRAGDVTLTFLNAGAFGETKYVLAPEYACNFPSMQDYVLLRDFNHDGAADIFCSATQIGSMEMQVFQGYFENNALKFKQYLFYYPYCLPCNPLHVWYPDDKPGLWNNLPISKADYPEVDDIDGDGDLDILTFAANIFGHVWYFKNKSVELGYGDDSLSFELTDDCWGRFYESGITACYNDLAPTASCCMPCFGPGTPVEDRTERHPGSTVMAYDKEGDGDKEIVLGDISFDCLNMMTNGGSPEQAWMVAQDTAFPSNADAMPVHVANFPASFYLDVNNDGKKDLLAAPNTKGLAEDQNCLWYYQNTATNGHYFKFMQKDLLTDDMIDVGTASHPTFADVNADGLLDLVVGNYGYYTYANGNNASLYLYLNTGTAGAPKFNLADKNWLDMAEFAPSDYDFAPTFGDLDGDGDLDLLVGSNFGNLYCYLNEAGPGNPMNLVRNYDIMWTKMDVGVASTPVIYDLDGDGRQDVVLGERQGNVNFFKNIGPSVTEPEFANSPTIVALGGISTVLPTDIFGFSAPALVPTQQDGPLLVVGSTNGLLQAYRQAGASATAFPVESLQFGNVYAGNRSHPAFADLDEDGILEMVVGNLRGGLTLYKTVLQDCTVATHETSPGSLPMLATPNPARDWVRVEWGADATTVRWRALQSLGQVMAEGETSGRSLLIPVKDWPAGIYFLEMSAEGRRGIVKIAVRRF